MTTQWNYFLQNLGEWHGSFTQLSPEGDLLEDTPTQLRLEGFNQNQSVRLTLRRFLPDPQDLVQDYQSLNRSILFFENGAFSQGSIQFAPFSEFGAEFGFIAGDRRLRLVQLFDRDSQLKQITLIRERRAGSDAPERSPLTVTDLLGEWQGEAVTLYPDWRSPDTYATVLSLHQEGDRLIQQLSFGNPGDNSPITSSATINGSRLLFDQSTIPVHVLLLPDGASATCPLHIRTTQPFFLETGWLLQADLRQRMIRRYSPKGDWNSLTLVTERKVR